MVHLRVVYGWSSVPLSPLMLTSIAETGVTRVHRYGLQQVWASGGCDLCRLRIWWHSWAGAGYLDIDVRLLRTLR